MKIFRKKSKIDGSRITLNTDVVVDNLEKEIIMWLINEDDIKLTTGGYLSDKVNAIFINPYYLATLKGNNVNEDIILKDICNIISHEFLHMWLYHEIGSKSCDGLDNICKYMEDITTECGGL